MAIRFRRVSRLCDPTNKELGKKVYPVISYQYDTSATLKEIAKEISSNSGVSEGETISVLKDFRTLLRKTLLAGRSVNIEGLGYFFLSAQSKGTEKAEDFTSADIQGLRICFRANSDIRLSTGTSTRSDGLKFKDLDHITRSDSGRGSSSDRSSSEISTVLSPRCFDSISATRRLFPVPEKNRIILSPVSLRNHIHGMKHPVHRVLYSGD